MRYMTSCGFEGLRRMILHMVNLLETGPNIAL